ncbi:glycosyltransferase [Citrus sinensis]|nr:glycosyltransferase [Citrus sinensis]
MTFGGGGFAISHRWFYVGSNSEGYEQNAKHSFDMTFGGGGFAISHSLARVLGRALDFCLMRYAHLYGSDARAFSCLVELGVGLNPEPSFHQLDMRGDMFCLLSQALQHLFKAVNVDPAGILQQTVCYDESSLLTVSVAWGYAIEVYEDEISPLTVL